MILLLAFLAAQAAPGPAAPAKDSVALHCKLIGADDGAHDLDLTIVSHDELGNVWTVRSDLPGLERIKRRRDVRRTQAHEKLPKFVPFSEGTPFRYVNVITGDDAPVYTIEISYEHTKYDNQSIVASIQISKERTYVEEGWAKDEISFVAAGLCRPRTESETPS